MSRGIKWGDCKASKEKLSQNTRNEGFVNLDVPLQGEAQWQTRVENERLIAPNTSKQSYGMRHNWPSVRAINPAKACKLVLLRTNLRRCGECLFVLEESCCLAISPHLYRAWYCPKERKNHGKVHIFLWNTSVLIFRPCKKYILCAWVFMFK